MKQSNNINPYSAIAEITEKKYRGIPRYLRRKFTYEYYSKV